MTRSFFREPVDRDLRLKDDFNGFGRDGRHLDGLHENVARSWLIRYPTGAVVNVPGSAWTRSPAPPLGARVVVIPVDLSGSDSLCVPFAVCILYNCPRRHNRITVEIRNVFKNVRKQYKKIKLKIHIYDVYKYLYITIVCVRNIRYFLFPFEL